jgi:hypothetical protein
LALPEGLSPVPPGSNNPLQNGDQRIEQLTATLSLA